MSKTTSALRATRCHRVLVVFLGAMVVYAALAMGFLAWSPAGLPQWTVGLWGLTLIGLGGGVLCLYRHWRVARWGAVGALLLMSGILTVFPLTDFLNYALQALGLAGLSLVFYDLEKGLGAPLALPGGLIFLAVVASILHTPIMVFAGLALLALGGVLAIGRM